MSLSKDKSKLHTPPKRQRREASKGKKEKANFWAYCP
jgi:hypothetical protein